MIMSLATKAPISLLVELKTSKFQQNAKRIEEALWHRQNYRR